MNGLLWSRKRRISRRRLVVKQRRLTGVAKKK